jgi:hypothetical protein
MIGLPGGTMAQRERAKASQPHGSPLGQALANAVQHSLQSSSSHFHGQAIHLRGHLAGQQTAI